MLFDLVIALQVSSIENREVILVLQILWQDSILVNSERLILSKDIMMEIRRASAFLVRRSIAFIH